MPQIKRGIVLEGGGSKGAYQVGAWKAFIEAGISFQAVSGASIGAVNGAFMVQGDFQKAMNFWQELSLKRHLLIDSQKARGFLFRFLTDLGLIFLPVPAGKVRVFHYAKYLAFVLKSFSSKGSVPYLLGGGLADIGLLESILFSHLDTELLLRSEIDLYVSVYQARKRSPLVKGGTTFKKAKHLKADTLRSYLLASVSFPLLLPSVKIGDKEYRDGEMESPDLISPLREQQLHQIFMVHSRYWKRRFLKAKPGGGIIHIIPSKDIGTLYQKTFNFSPKRITELIEMGYQDTLERISMGIMS